MRQESNRVIGIDIHPRCFAAAAFSGKKEKLWVHSRIEMTDLDFWLKRHTRPGDTLVLESGCNSISFAKKAATYQVECVILDSVKVGKISKAYCKTDKNDCEKIAKIYQSDLADKIWEPDQKTILRRQVLSKYGQANKAVSKSKNMIKSFLIENGINFPKGKKIYSKSGREWLMTLKELDLIQKKILDLLYKDLAHALTTKKALASIMAQELINDENAWGLLKLCGIRTVCAFALVAAAGDIKRFSNPKKFAAYLGLVPSVNQSGDNIRHGGVGKSGRKETRTYIVQGAHALFKSSDEYGAGFKQWGLKMIMKKGKHTAVIAVARKMAIAAWYQMNGYKTNIHIPERNMNVKIQKISVEIGKEVLKEIGYENPMDFREEMKQKLVNVA